MNIYADSNGVSVVIMTAILNKCVNKATSNEGGPLGYNT